MLINRAWLVVLIILLIYVLWDGILNRSERKGREEAKRVADEYLTRRGTIES